MYITASIKTE